MDDKLLRRYGPNFHASDAVIAPPLLFLIGWGAVKVYQWIGPGGDWRIPIEAGWFTALLSLIAIIHNAAPRSMRELRFITVWILICGSVLVGLFVLLDKDGFSWEALAIAAMIVALTFVGYTGMLRKYKENDKSIAANEAASLSDTHSEKS